MKKLLTGLALVAGSHLMAQNQEAPPRNNFTPIHFTQKQAKKWVDPRFSSQPNFIDATLYAPGRVHVMMRGLKNPKDTLELNIENAAIDLVPTDSIFGSNGDQITSFQYTHKNDDINLPKLVRTINFNREPKIYAYYQENSIDTERVSISEDYMTRHVWDNFGIIIFKP